MKVLHIITCVADSGGSEKLMEDLLPGLRRQGIDISCLVFNGFDSQNRRLLEKEGIKVYELGHNAHYYNPLFFFKLIPYLRRFDIVHAHNTPAVLFTALSGLFGTAHLVMTVHSAEGKLRNFWWGRLIDKWIYRHFGTIICCSSIAEQNLLKEYPFLKDKTITINNGVNLSKFIDASPSKEILENADKRVTMVARFRKEKNHMALIDALKFLPDAFHVFFVGDGDTKNACEMYACDCQVAQRVHFLGLRTDVPSILKASDYIVLSSRFEGLSLSSIEGMAAGKPFIASDVNGLREVVGGAGVLFPEGDGKSLAEVIIDLETNPKKYLDIAKQCAERAMQYSISNMIAGYREVYLRIE